MPKLGYAQSVNLANVTTAAIGGGSNCSDSATSNCKDLVTEVGDGSSDSPHVVYVPIYNADGGSGAGPNHLYSLLYTGSGDATADLPSYDSSSSANSGNIVTQLTINSGSAQTSQVLYAGILDGFKNGIINNDGWIPTFSLIFLLFIVSISTIILCNKKIKKINTNSK